MVVPTDVIAPHDTLARAFQGRLLRPGDDGYERARWTDNAAFDRRPHLIAQPRDVADIAAAIAHARAEDLPLAVRAGGHSMAGHGTGDGTLVIDLSRMRDIEIAPDGTSAWAQGGVLAGDYTRAVQATGGVTPFGDTGSVGVAGITLGGGVGWLARKHGLSIDSLLAAEIVTADGSVIVADADAHPDLFWAVRGAGANFGVVSRLRFRLHQLDHVLAGDIVLPATTGVIASLIPTLLAAPDELTAMPMIMRAPSDPSIPADMQGRLVVYLSVAWSGSPQAGERALAPLRAMAPPIADTITRKAYTDLFPPSMAEDAPTWGIASRAVLVDALDDATIEVIRRRLTEPSASEALVQVRVLGGALARIPNDATAFGWRDRAAIMWIIDPYQDLGRAAEHEAWTAAFHADLRGPSPATYVNFMGSEGADAVRTAYPRSTFARLREVKRRYDPDNVFRANQNIPPA